MDAKFQITIPKPCHEDWNKMTPDEMGRFCSVCSKEVIDFTSKNSDEIESYFNENTGKKICGKFNNNQLKQFNIEIKESVLFQKRTFHHAFLLALFVVMGTSLFSCKSYDDAQLGKINVVQDTANCDDRLMGDTIYVPQDTLKTKQTLGMSLPPESKTETTDKKQIVKTKP